MAAHSIAVGARSAVLASADAAFRRRVGDALIGLRWQVREAKGGAEALACVQAATAETVVVDAWLPDLEIREFIGEFRRLHPEIDVVSVDPTLCPGESGRSARRNEVLHALRCAAEKGSAVAADAEGPHGVSTQRAARLVSGEAGAPIPELIGSDPLLVEVRRRIRLVAPRS